MDVTQPTLFRTLKQRLAWLGQRQEVLARNIANADTPGFRPSDLHPFGDAAMTAGSVRSVDMVSTRPAHMSGRRRHDDGFATRVDRNPYETAPAGNAVVLEEQMAKLNHTAVSHRLASELYRKHLGMINTATGRR
mgnify:CR=1 FL=1